MKNIKKMMMAMSLLAVLMVGNTYAGILIQGKNSGNPDPCNDATSAKTGVILSDVKEGILIQGFTGILIQGFTGILIQGIKEETPACGIILAD